MNRIFHHIITTLFCFLLSAFCFFPLSAQNNRLTNEDGQLIWQYNQMVHLSNEEQNTIHVSLIFINGVKQTAISLRQEHFHSQIEWREVSECKVEKEDRVQFSTVNLAPHQSVVWKYDVKTKPIDKELLLERSAILMMNEDFEVRKEFIPEQHIQKQ
jgi:hypothetical protein